MDRLSLVALMGVFALALLVIGWRFLSQRYQLPCPSAFIWMLENRIMENVAGSEVLIQRAQIKPGMAVLDAGCGPGRVTVPLALYATPAGSVTALDIQPEMLERLQVRVRRAGLLNVKIIQAGLGDGKLPPEVFDRALLNTVLGEIPDQKAALLEIYTSLKPGGLLSITEILPDPHYQSRKKVRRLAEETGYNPEEVYSGWRAYTMNLIKPL